MFGIGGWELLVIAVVALIVLGPKGLPSAARAIGKVVTQLRKATQDLRDTIELDPELRELPKAIDEINRPFLTNPARYRRSPTPKDQPDEDAANRPPPVARNAPSEVERNKPNIESVEDTEPAAAAVDEEVTTEDPPKTPETEELGGDG